MTNLELVRSTAQRISDLSEKGMSATSSEMAESIRLRPAIPALMKLLSHSLNVAWTQRELTECAERIKAVKL